MLGSKFVDLLPPAFFQTYAPFENQRDFDMPLAIVTYDQGFD